MLRRCDRQDIGRRSLGVADKLNERKNCVTVCMAGMSIPCKGVSGSNPEHGLIVMFN